VTDSGWPCGSLGERKAAGWSATNTGTVGGRGATQADLTAARSMARQALDHALRGKLGALQARIYEPQERVAASDVARRHFPGLRREPAAPASRRTALAGCLKPPEL
jgi:hypothetical protein